MEMETRLHTTNNPSINLNLIYPQRQMSSKPEGLWYGIDNGWFDWASVNMPEKVGKYTFKLDVDTNRIKTIDSLDSLQKFIKTYETTIEPFIFIDWERLTKEFAGIEIHNYSRISNKIWDINHFWVSMWDCNSGCIWDLDCINAVKRRDTLAEWFT